MGGEAAAAGGGGGGGERSATASEGGKRHTRRRVPRAVEDVVEDGRVGDDRAGAQITLLTRRVVQTSGEIDPRIRQAHHILHRRRAEKIVVQSVEPAPCTVSV